MSVKRLLRKQFIRSPRHILEERLCVWLIVQTVDISHVHGRFHGTSSIAYITFLVRYIYLSHKDTAKGRDKRG